MGTIFSHPMDRNLVQHQLQFAGCRSWHNMDQSVFFPNTNTIGMNKVVDQRMNLNHEIAYPLFDERNQTNELPAVIRQEENLKASIQHANIQDSNITLTNQYSGDLLKDVENKSENIDCNQNKSINNNNTIVNQYQKEEKGFLRKIDINIDLIVNMLPGSCKQNVCDIHNWGYMCTYTLVYPHEQVFRTIMHNLRQAEHSYYLKESLFLLSIERVTNPYLMAMYELKKNELMRKYEHWTERMMYHGAEEWKIDEITMSNFDYRLCGSNRGTKFGCGVSFSRKLSYAHHFCSDANYKTVLYCKVLFAKAHVGNETTVVPEEGFDSTKNDHGSVIVKYDDDVFYPAYKVTYNAIEH